MSELEREKAEIAGERAAAIQLAHMACDERDRIAAEAAAALAQSNRDNRRLQEALADVLDAVAGLSSSPMPLISRRRLRLLLA